MSPIETALLCLADAVAIVLLGGIAWRVVRWAL
jgi:hypothetical protein